MDTSLHFFNWLDYDAAAPAACSDDDDYDDDDDLLPALPPPRSALRSASFARRFSRARASRAAWVNIMIMR